MNTIAVIVVTFALFTLFAGAAAIVVAAVMMFLPSKKPEVVLTEDAITLTRMNTLAQYDATRSNTAI